MKSSIDTKKAAAQVSAVALLGSIQVFCGSVFLGAIKRKKGLFYFLDANSQSIVAPNANSEKFATDIANTLLIDDADFVYYLKQRCEELIEQ